MMTNFYLYLILTMSLMGSSGAYAQARAVQKSAVESPEPKLKTQLENFLAKKGVVFIKEYGEAGKIDGSYSIATVKSLIIYETSADSKKIRGLQITVASGQREHTSFLDLDEAESLSAAISYMQSIVPKYKNVEHEGTEVTFSTKGGFGFGFFVKKEMITVFVESGYISEVSGFFKQPESMADFKKIIDKGIELAKN